MPTKKEKITIESLLGLGVVKLSEILVEISDFDRNVEKRLEKALLAKTSTKKYASSIRKQITSLANSKKFHDYYQSEAYGKKLDLIRKSIASDLFPYDPVLAADLFRLFLQNASKIIENVDSSYGNCQVPLNSLGRDLANCYQRIDKINIDEIILMILELSNADEYDFADNLVEYFSSIIGVDGLNKLEILAKKHHYQSRKGRSVDLLRDVADELGNVDKYIEACQIDDSNERKAMEIVKRLLKAQRFEEALNWINNSKYYKRLDMIADYKISALTGLNRTKEAQEIRWEMFGKFLNERYYVEFLDNEPDEEIFKKYQAQAIEIAKNHLDIDLSVNFLMWLNEPVLIRETIFKRQSDISGSNYKLLREIAAFLIESGEFEAAAILYRSMTLSVLEKANSKYYSYAISDYVKAKDCDERFRGKIDVPSHKEFEAELLQDHGRKTSFWNLVMEAENKNKLIRHQL
ncbi:MAG: hypothetical protein ACI9TO_001118 [Rickettsiales bacterium]|jgi:hypothetical protein